MTERENIELKEQKLRIRKQKFDRGRSLRVVEYLDFSTILESSPVEINEGYIVSDRDTCDIFASFVFKSVSPKPISELKVRLICYQNQNIPYLNIDFTYSHSELTFGMIEKKGAEMKLKDANRREAIYENECFGSAVYIPIPETYFKRMEVMLVSVTFENAGTYDIDKIAGGKAKSYSELDDFSKIVYTRLNIYQSAEERFPTVVIPEEGDNVWLCCCGTKNSKSNEVCERCGREKEWQMQNITSDRIEETKREMISNPEERVLHDKTNFAQNKHLESKEEISRKIEKYETVMKNVAEMEKRREKRNAMIIPKILIYVVVMLLILLIIKVLMSF